MAKTKTKVPLDPVTRAELVKLIAYQIQEDVERERLDAVAALDLARSEFRAACADYVFGYYRNVIDSMRGAAGGVDASRVIADAKYELDDEELEKPRDSIRVVVRDGAEYECSFRLAIPITLNTSGTIWPKRQAWIHAKRRLIKAEAAGAKLKDVTLSAWNRAISEALKSTDEGQQILGLLAKLRKAVQV